MRRASFSSYGPQVRLAAPGVDILSLRARGTDLLAVSEAPDYRGALEAVFSQKGRDRLGELAEAERVTATESAWLDARVYSDGEVDTPDRTVTPRRVLATQQPLNVVLNHQSIVGTSVAPPNGTVVPPVTSTAASRTRASTSVMSCP